MYNTSLTGQTRPLSPFSKRENRVSNCGQSFKFNKPEKY